MVGWVGLFGVMTCVRRRSIDCFALAAAFACLIRSISLLLCFDAGCVDLARCSGAAAVASLLRLFPLLLEVLTIDLIHGFVFSVVLFVALALSVMVSSFPAFDSCALFSSVFVLGLSSSLFLMSPDSPVSSWCF